MDRRLQPMLLRTGLFAAVLLVVWVLGTIAFSSPPAGFVAGLIVATFSTGAARLVVRRDGSWSLLKRR